MERNIRTQDSEIFAENILCLALDVGEGLLRSGAEISRVEDTMERICKAYGAAHVEVFSIISFIHAAVRMPDGSYSSQLRRIRVTKTNLNKLEKFNALSREICEKKPPLEEVDCKIKEIKKTPEYNTATKIVASSLAVGGFALFFGGSVWDALVAALIGALICVIGAYATNRLNSMARTVISSFIATLLAYLSVKVGIGSSEDYIIMGSIMILVPGLAFGTALRDLLCGDLLAGTLKTLEACLSALMIAFGYILAVIAMGGVV